MPWHLNRAFVCDGPHVLDTLMPWKLLKVFNVLMGKNSDAFASRKRKLLWNENKRKMSKLINLPVPC